MAQRKIQRDRNDFHDAEALQDERKGYRKYGKEKDKN